MEVRDLDSISIGDADAAHTCRSEIHRDGRAESTRADDQDTRFLETVLSRGADIRQSRLPSVSGELVPVKCAGLGVARGGLDRREAVTRGDFHVLTRDVEAPKYTRPPRTGMGVASNTT